MSKVLKLTSVTLAASSLAAAGYFYAFDRDSYHYKNASWKRIGDHVQGILDRKEDIAVQRTSSEARDVTVRPIKETMKDLWNEQVRNTAQWVYSFGSNTSTKA
ncbi:Mic12p [Lachancea thermotolerans CBS 6340]|uniref:MICOS complex subunit MIC12 n=1 Tax=Lachancea thermotolerans (strain ATCC 56472 / CBS 6340 / NRRL Y-8284) TaxID=559295 RepID=MIC12_LACTC|nr:KLTH0H11088p [Lachancea thermotolerans CBS 6340]C5E381.1 RecName: Full=MICOS complex subunit MIC12; AltName: Full=Altered inheritance of mitochondria protein 5, mitochondrial; AltName: Full=Found in mitochondrial proteome protein 51 [Lachancea thermotolerans CBS 6340]CAR30492.1 KLTH0H11088p [Lachancea thermotolerans CBS 6340]